VEHNNFLPRVNIQGFLNSFQLIVETLVLVLGSLSKLCNTHFFNIFFQVTLLTVKLSYHLFSFEFFNHLCTRRPFVEPDLPLSLLFLLLFLPSSLLEVLWNCSKLWSLDNYLILLLVFYSPLDISADFMDILHVKLNIQLRVNFSLFIFLLQLLH
jgi:hypothetical protein